MPAPASMMPSIEERKRLIVLQADLHRALLHGEIVAIRERLAGFDSMREKVRHASPWLGLAAAVGGLLAARNWRSVAGWIPTALAAWRWFQKLRKD